MYLKKCSKSSKKSWRSGVPSFTVLLFSWLVSQKVFFFPFKKRLTACRLFTHGRWRKLLLMKCNYVQTDLTLFSYVLCRTNPCFALKQKVCFQLRVCQRQEELQKIFKSRLVLRDSVQEEGDEEIRSLIESYFNWTFREQSPTDCNQCEHKEVSVQTTYSLRTELPINWS